MSMRVKSDSQNRHLAPQRFLSIRMRGLVVMIASMLVALAASQSAAETTIDDTRTALEQWVETQRVLSQEKRDFQLAKEMLEERLTLLQREITSLKEKITDAEKSIAEADKTREALIRENEELQETSTSLAGTCTLLEEKTKTLLVQLPDPIRERIKPLSQRLPENAENTKSSTSERFQNVVGMLNEISKFNRDISVVTEVRSMPDGTSVEVSALYLGLGQGYYTGSNDTVAGIGTASKEGWVWTPANDSVSSIADAIAILKNEKVASFVRLPIQIQ